MKIFINGEPFECHENEKLLPLIRNKGLEITAACAGKGSCGKCRVSLENPKQPCEAEKKFLSRDELDVGVRLACMTRVFDGMRVSVSKSSNIKAVGVENTGAGGLLGGKIAAVADIGTTTLVLALADTESCKIVDSISANNPQAVFGADVMTRIKSSDEDGGEQHRLIVARIAEMLEQLIKRNNISVPERLYISGNTTMLHLFFGENCHSLGVFPYAPVFLESKTLSGSQLGFLYGIEIVSLPGIASFIGADITAGILCLLSESEKYDLLIDLGTNAEIVLFNNKEIYASSAAAGPAFEGANIRCGMAAVAGAVNGFHADGENVNFSTIDSVLPAKGICGSGLIDLAAELLKHGSIDSTGLLLCDSYVIDGGVALYPEDIRELQLAKSAICSVIEILVNSAGIEYNDINKVYLSGGFGSYINAANAASIGLIPRCLAEKLCAVGNTSLKGTLLYASQPALREKADWITQNAKVLELSSLEEYSNRFIENIMFD